MNNGSFLNVALWVLILKEMLMDWFNNYKEEIGILLLKGMSFIKWLWKFLPFSKKPVQQNPDTISSKKMKSVLLKIFGIMFFELKTKEETTYFQEKS